MDREKRKELQRLVAEVEKKSWQAKLNPTLFHLALQCVARAPIISYEKIVDIIKMILCLIDAGFDYTLLLKTGILTGEFPDYRIYKRAKANEFIKQKGKAKINDDLEGFRKSLNDQNAYIYQSGLIIPIDIRWLNKLFSFLPIRDERAMQEYRVLWNRLDKNKKGIAKEINPESCLILTGDGFNAAKNLIIGRIGSEKEEAFKNKLNLDLSKWYCRYGYVFNRLEISIGPSQNPDMKIIKGKEENLFDSEDTTGSLWGQRSLFVYDHFETEEIKFVSIFQNRILPTFTGRAMSFYSIEHQLNDYFMETHRGRAPQPNELNMLTRRYYRFIQKAYPRWEAAEDVVNNVLPEGGSSTMTIIVPGRRDFFYMRHGKRQDGNHATLHYDVKKRAYYLYHGSQLASTIDDIGDSGISDFITINSQKKFIRKLQNGGYRVLKNIAIASPSKAAWLVCGYKRNGLDCWKNSKDETLRSFLISKGHSPASKKTNSKSASSPLVDPEEHLNGGQATPAPR